MTEAGGRPRRGWWASNWVWVVPVGCLGLVAIAVALVGGLVFAVFGSLRQSWACEHGLELVRGSPAVVAALGEPIEAGFWVSGSVSVSGPSGSADLAVPIHGPKGTGTLYVRATRKAGAWSLERAEVAVEGRAERIELLEENAPPALEVRGPGGVLSRPIPAAADPSTEDPRCASPGSRP